MSVEQQIKDRIVELIDQGSSLRQGNRNTFNMVRDQHHSAECAGWIAAALNVVQLVIYNPASAYRLRADEIAKRKVGARINSDVGEFVALLENLRQDIDKGLLASIVNVVRAETFDDFLDHAKAYLREEKKQEAGVIAGVVFEDSLRQVCRQYGIDEKGQRLDSLINELARRQVLTQVKAKRARVAADVRTKATHAQWDEFDLKDVGVTVDFTEEFISNQLDK